MKKVSVAFGLLWLSAMDLSTMLSDQPAIMHLQGNPNSCQWNQWHHSPGANYVPFENGVRGNEAAMQAYVRLQKQAHESNMYNYYHYLMRIPGMDSQTALDHQGMWYANNIMQTYDVAQRSMISYTARPKRTRRKINHKNYIERNIANLLREDPDALTFNEDSCRPHRKPRKPESPNKEEDDGLTERENGELKEESPPSNTSSSISKKTKKADKQGRQPLYYQPSIGAPHYAFPQYYPMASTPMVGAPPGTDMPAMASQFFASNTGGVIGNCSKTSHKRNGQLATLQQSEVMVSPSTLAPCNLQEMSRASFTSAALPQAAQLPTGDQLHSQGQLWQNEMTEGPTLSALTCDTNSACEWQSGYVQEPCSSYSLGNSDNTCLPPELESLRVDQLFTSPGITENMAAEVHEDFRGEETCDPPRVSNTALNSLLTNGANDSSED